MSFLFFFQEMKRQRSIQEDTKRGNEEKAAITETQRKPSEDEVLNVY